MQMIKWLWNLNIGKYHSESESAEEELDVVCFIVCFGVWEVSISFWEFFSDFFSSCLFILSCFKSIFLKILEVEVIDNESSWDDVILVDVFNEWLNSCSFDEFSLVNSSLDSSRIAGDADQE